MQLFNHQQKIINEDPKKCGLFLGTGSGKGLIAIMLARGKTLVICPKMLRDDKTWQRNLEKSGKKLDLTIVSKEDFRRDWQTYTRYDTIIVDESHTVCSVMPTICYKNKKPYPKASQLFESLQSFIQQTAPERLYLLTATPIRSPMSIYATGIILGRNWDFYRFRDIYYTPVRMNNREIWLPKKDEATKVRLAECVKKLGFVGQLSDYFDVPLQTYKTVYVELTEKQKQRLKELPTEYPEPIVLCGKKHQVENGILSGDEFNDIEYFDNEKIEKIREYALEFPKMVIFAKYRAQITNIAQALIVDGYNVLQLTGDTKDREDVLAQANNSNKCIIIISAQISAGYELPDFPVMIFASMSYSIVDRIQAEGRILRLTNLKKNLIINLVSKGSTVDEAVYKTIELKQDFSEAVYAKQIYK